MPQTAADEESLREYSEFLILQGLSGMTCKRYVHDAKTFMAFLDSREINLEILDEFITWQTAKYNAASVQTAIYGVNRYLEFIDCPHRIECMEQPHAGAYPDGSGFTAEEYLRILNAVKRTGDQRLYAIVETVCGTGLKLSQLKYLTVEALDAGRVILPPDQRVYLSLKLCEDLREYCADNGIGRGIIFRTRCGNLPDRSNISRSIKKACESTGIELQKINMKTLRGFYRYNFENMRGRIADLLDESLRTGGAAAARLPSREKPCTKERQGC